MTIESMEKEMISVNNKFKELQDEKNIHLQTINDLKLQYASLIQQGNS